jgi:hypothetical protein
MCKVIYKCPFYKECWQVREEIIFENNMPVKIIVDEKKPDDCIYKGYPNLRRQRITGEPICKMVV